MKLAFYIAEHGDFFDKAINFWTGRRGYSHVELVFSDGISFSASPREGSVRFKEIDYDYKWKVIDIEVSEWREEKLMALAYSLDGKDYDWKGIILHQFLPMGIDDKDKWWCSELVAYMLGTTPFKINPNDFAEQYGL